MFDVPLRFLSVLRRRPYCLRHEVRSCGARKAYLTNVHWNNNGPYRVDHDPESVRNSSGSNEYMGTLGK